MWCVHVFYTLATAAIVTLGCAPGLFLCTTLHSRRGELTI